MRFAGPGLPALARALAAAILLIVVSAAWTPVGAQDPVRPPRGAVEGFSDPAQSGQVPGNTLGGASDADLWREIKGGGTGFAASDDPNFTRLVQYEGQLWREIHNGPLPRYGAWALLAVIVILALLFAVAGRVKIHGGRSGKTITRFTALERAAHWLTASSFVLLALTGLNILYGRSVMIPLVGKDAFAAIAIWGKYIHNYVAFAFIAGLIIIFVQWVVYNFPNRHDLVWLAKGGGILVKNVHAPAKKFNAGQKIIFWLTILGGASLAVSGWALLYPFSTHFMTETFELAAKVGLDIPAWFGLPEPPYSAIMEQQMNQVWHGMMGLFLTAVIIAHIYIGTLGMEGAFEAMGTGEVDENWAREHHNLWVEDLERKRSGEAAGSGAAAQQPAE
ncbi:MAG: formate dehydrogenase subunit gamma [Propylenella sp.]